MTYPRMIPDRYLAKWAERQADYMAECRRLGMAAWLADNDGVPFEVQHLFDLSEYEAQAQEIEDMRK